jgi:hypothetical protein
LVLSATWALQSWLQTLNRGCLRSVLETFVGAFFRHTYYSVSLNSGVYTLLVGEGAENRADTTFPVCFSFVPLGMLAPDGVSSDQRLQCPEVLEQVLGQFEVELCRQLLLLFAERLT